MRSVDDVVDRQLTLPDGRVLGWTESAVLDGAPLLRMPGTPGSRFSLRADRTPWIERGLRAITVERPGFGISTPAPGRGFAEPADDTARLLDHLGIDAVPVVGGSGAAPHELAFASRHADRVLAVTILVGAAPVLPSEVDTMIDENVTSWHLAQAGDRAGLTQLLAGIRHGVLADPVVEIIETMSQAPPADQDIMTDPDWQDALARGTVEALRLGVDGWVDESLAIDGDWADIDTDSVSASVTWWHSDEDRNCPLSAAARLVESLPNATLRVWPGAGHLAGHRHEAEVLEDLLMRSADARGRGRTSDAATP
ncbi:MAG: alpha/beta hydrolase [Actinomycetes bacterium]